MAKKFIFIFLFVLFLSVSCANVCASGNLDELDNRAETESLAGLTWDEISEMASNSPNSLTPTQGLVLWMFAILAFLKLAQKMDSLLQSLGLNVTQTGGRALGDLVMAGMALKNIGGAVSKGLGMLGGSESSGGSGSGSSSGSGTHSGTSSSGGGSASGGSSGGGSGHTSIPLNSPRSGSTSGDSASSGSASSGFSSNGSTSSGSTSGGSAPSGSASSGSASRGSSSSTPTNNTTPDTDTTTPKATDPNSTTINRTPVGKAVDWLKQDGFTQGAIKASAKGGVIGLGVYTAKAGASKVSEAVAARLNGSDSTPKGGQPPTNNKNSFGTIGVNPEEYQNSRPLDNTDEQAAIPSTANTEQYQESSGYSYSNPSEESSIIPASFNNEDYNDVNSSNAPFDTSPTSTVAKAEQDLANNAGDLSPDAVNNEAWNEAWNKAWNEATPPPITQKEGGKNEHTARAKGNGGLTKSHNRRNRSNKNV
ncbi:MAG: hypothetical protein FWG87_01745 [Defluviitaleaceae bacterium]|nr:hypothetical protein [Defluviitaleaceae bacterium]